MKKISIALLLFVSIVGTPILATSSAHAINPSDFDAGRIIDDEVFYNKNAMGSAQAVQDFIRAHTPSCDTWGTQPSGYGNLNNAQYAQQIKGWPGPPYVCLQNYYENPNTGETSFEKGGGSFDGGQSAGQIIWNASQQYGINPQVLLVTLRKESLNLFGDSWPLKSQYRYAMGYACPDSGPNYSAACVDSKAGFYKQVTLAAWQFRYYYDHMGDYNYAPGRWNTIQYSPDPSCGTKSVYIQNYATASLYIYTPYTPNDAALNAYPGTAPCGAYGNRNFWFMWQEWFGSPYGRAVATPLSITTSDDKGQRFTGDPIQLSFTVTNQSRSDFLYKTIGIAGRDPNGGNIDQVWLNNLTLRAGESRTISATYTPTMEGQYQFFVSSWLDGDVGFRACQLNSTESTCFNPYTIQKKPQFSMQYTDATKTTTRRGDTVPMSYTITNPSQYAYQGGNATYTTWITGGIASRNTVGLPDVAAGATKSATINGAVPVDKNLINYQLTRGTLDATTPNMTAKPALTLTQGLTLSNNNPRAKANVTGSFKVKNFSDHTVTTNDQLCYIIRDTATNGNHDFGCLALGTFQAGEEKTFSKVGYFGDAGAYKATLNIFNGSYWRSFDTYTPETGTEKTTLDFNVKPAVTLTQGLSIGTSTLRSQTNFTGSFKLKNFSDQAITTNDQLCYIIRDKATNSNNDLGCFPIGTLQAGEERTYSRIGHLDTPGQYKAYFAIYNGSSWRSFDTYVPETGTENTSLDFTVKPALSLTQGLTLSDSNPRAKTNVTGSFKIKNFSDHAITTNDQVCYIIRDTATNGNHDFGCLVLGTLQAGQEKTFSQVGFFSDAGQYKANFAIYNGSYWRPFDTYTPETGSEPTTLTFQVKPALELTGGMSTNPASPQKNTDFTGSFKVTNFSDQVVTTNDQLCYIIRDVATNGNHDLGCFPLGTLQPGQEVTYSRVGRLDTAGQYKAYFAIYNGSQWRAFDSNSFGGVSTLANLTFTVTN